MYFLALNAGKKTIYSEVDFSYAVFKGEVLLTETKFNADISFQAIVAERPIRITKCKFSQDPDFRGVRVGHRLFACVRRRNDALRCHAALTYFLLLEERRR